MITLGLVPKHTSKMSSSKYECCVQNKLTSTMNRIHTDMYDNKILKLEKVKIISHFH